MHIRAGEEEQAGPAQHHYYACQHKVFQRLAYDLHHAILRLPGLHVIRSQVIILTSRGRIGVVDLQTCRLAVDRYLGEEVARGAVGVLLHREIIQLQLLRQEDRDPLFADGLVVRAVAKYGYAQRLLLGASNYTGKECQPQTGMVQDKAPAVAPRAEAPPQGDHPQMGKQGEQTRYKYPRGREMVESQSGGQPRTLGGLCGRELREEPDDQTADYELAQRPVCALRREPHPDERRRAFFLVGIRHPDYPEQG